jgi:phage tail sheath protein FI
MASIPSYPGVHLREVPSGTQTIGGVSTSVAAFVGYLPEGPHNEAVRVFSFAEFSRHFGGLDADSETSYAVRQFFLNGGAEAWIVRVTSAASASTVTFDDSSDDRLTLDAASPGEWGDELQAAIYPGTGSFDLVVRRVQSDTVLAEEVIRDLDPAGDFAARISAESSLVVATEKTETSSTVPISVDPLDGDTDAPDDDDFVSLEHGDNGTVPGEGWTDSTRSAFANALQGLDANADVVDSGIRPLADIAPFAFNILCLPDGILFEDSPANGHTTADSLYETAAEFCDEQDAFLLVDLPADLTEAADLTSVGAAAVSTWADGLRHKNAATYFPLLDIADPLDDHNARTVGPSGTLAGLYARIDASRGIWKAPAGTEAKLRGAEPSQVVIDSLNGVFNDSGINVLRTFAGYGPVSWGARTLVGNEEGDNKYVPVRRMTLFLKKSLELGLKWAVFEPNGEKLWATIRLTVESFLNRLYRQGAFKGATTSEAYFVLCDSTTTTADDINLGMVNVVVGFAPLKPAEFVVVQLQQMAGQAES